MPRYISKMLKLGFEILILVFGEMEGKQIR